METMRIYRDELYALPPDFAAVKREYHEIPEFIEDGSDEAERSGFLFRIICMVEGGTDYKDLHQLDIPTLKILDNSSNAFMDLQEAIGGKLQRSQALDRIVLARVFGTEKH